MVIYLTHPKHGSKVATSEQEATYDESNGWSRNVTQATGEVLKDREELTKQYVDKFGRKPHWKASVETIRGELCQPP